MAVYADARQAQFNIIYRLLTQSSNARHAQPCFLQGPILLGVNLIDGVLSLPLRWVAVGPENP